MKVELWFLFSAHREIMLYICTRFCEKYPEGFGSSSADTISSVKFAEGHNSVKNVDGVMVLVLYMSFDDALYWYKVS